MQKHLDIIKPRLPGQHKPKFSKKQKIIFSVTTVIVIAAAISLFLWLKFINSSAAYIQHDKYQAVFMSNNQVYFGKLQKLGDGSYRLTDVYYIKSPTGPTGTSASSTAQPTTGQSGDESQKPQLVKLGIEIHGPTDEVMIPPANLLFWENLKPDGTVSKSIAEYKKNNS